MNASFRFLGTLLTGETNADRVVPPSGYTARLTSFTAGAMAFLAVFALALALATGRLADRWSAELARTATIRISAPQGQMDAQSKAALAVLETTPGVKSARVLGKVEQRKLLEPWFGPDLPLDSLPIPRLIEVVEDQNGPDIEGLRLRLAAEAPGAIFDDHTRWRKPLIDAAMRLRLLAAFSIALIALSTASLITLAANAALSANATVIAVLRLVGAKDSYIARAFVRRFTIRALVGAFAGTVGAVLAVSLLPSPAAEGAFLTGLGFRSWHWVLPFFIPPLSAIVAFWATRAAAFRTLRKLS